MLLSSLINLIQIKYTLLFVRLWYNDKNNYTETQKKVFIVLSLENKTYWYNNNFKCVCAFP